MNCKKESMYQMNLQPKFFDFIKDGTKRIELRLFDEKRQKIKVGDTIEFSKSPQRKFVAEVVELLRYDSFEELFKDFDIVVLADKSMTKAELLETLNGFYPAEKQAEFGVVGIRIELPNDNFSYLKNIERIKKLCERDPDFSKLSLDDKKNIIDNGEIDGIKIYQDPDLQETKDEKFYEALAEHFGFERRGYNLYDKGIKLSSDCMMSWKLLLEMRGGDVAKMLEDYEKIRSHKSAHLVWPQHKDSINTERCRAKDPKTRYKTFIATRIQDRTDYTFYDIKLFYHELKRGLSLDEQDFSRCKLEKAYKNELTFDWLTSFDSFEDFIDKMKNYKYFVDTSDCENYKIFDFVTGKEVPFTEEALDAWKNTTIEITPEYRDALIKILDKIPDDIMK